MTDREMKKRLAELEERVETAAAGERVREGRPREQKSDPGDAMTETARSVLLAELESNRSGLHPAALQRCLRECSALHEQIRLLQAQAAPDGQPAVTTIAELRRLLKDALPWLELLGSVGPIPSAPDDPDRAELQRVIQLIRLEVTP